jgi:predicted Zn-dependent protease with MMP-like domain
MKRASLYPVPRFRALSRGKAECRRPPYNPAGNASLIESIYPMAYHVNRATFESLVERALAQLPPQFVQYLEEVPVEIRPASTRAQRRKAGVDDDELLLGLYQGIPRTDRSVEHSGTMPDVIYIFQEDVELAVDNERDLVEEVRITVLHELGHHFGLDEDDLDALGYG